MKYLLDTNACIALINGRPLQVRERFAQAVAEGAELLLSSIVLFELWYGVAKSKRQEENTERVEAFLSGPVDLVAFDEDDGHVAGGIRSNLERAGASIGAYDTLIAGQALQRGAILVTANTSEFSRIDGLAWENWAA
jgi:tRNA(fMet)-specific endonuclease VapC